MSKDNHEPKARALSRSLVWRNPEYKRCEAIDRNRTVKAEGCEASCHMAAKPTGTRLAVNAAYVHRQFAFLHGEICAALAVRWVRGITRHRFTRDTKNKNGLRAAQTGGLHSGLVGMLWHQLKLPINPGTG